MEIYNSKYTVFLRYLGAIPHGLYRCIRALLPILWRVWDMGEVAIARWQAKVLLDLRAADLYETKLRYICEMEKGMGKNFFLREVGFVKR